MARRSCTGLRPAGRGKIGCGRFGRLERELVTALCVLGYDGDGNRVQSAIGSTTTTDCTYTGQYSNMDDFGLLFYNARWCDPASGRFTRQIP